MHDLGSWAPSTEGEAHAAAKAVALHREQENALDAIEALSDFERALIEFAYDLGREDVNAAVRRALGSAAATADVAALRQALDQVGDLRVRNYPPRARQFMDAPRVGEIVLSARRRAEAEERNRALVQERAK